MTTDWKRPATVAEAEATLAALKADGFRPWNLSDALGDAFYETALHRTFLHQCVSTGDMGSDDGETITLDQANGLLDAGLGLAAVVERWHADAEKLEAAIVARAIINLSTREGGDHAPRE